MVCGQRQVGKSTMLNQIKGKRKYTVVDSEDQAADLVAELKAQGTGASYKKLEEGLGEHLPKKNVEKELDRVYHNNFTNKLPTFCIVSADNLSSVSPVVCQ